jgi:hypothetical protein
MGRGRGADAIFEAFEEVNSRNGDLTGTALEEVLPLELEQDEEVILRSLFDCSMGDPEAPGFLPQAGDDEKAADALVEKGLAEKNEEGWKLNKAGFQLMGQYLSTDFFG